LGSHAYALGLPTVRLLARDALVQELGLAALRFTCARAADQDETRRRIAHDDTNTHDIAS
jgi:hypothetical protein